VISCTLRIIIVLMETIKDLYQTAVTAWAKSLTHSGGVLVGEPTASKKQLDVPRQPSDIMQTW
jgi:hypothetical protein